MKTNIFVELLIDNLDARLDLNKSDRISGYEFTEEEIKIIMGIIKAYKKRKGIRDRD